jgi:hypothetical protein
MRKRLDQREQGESKERLNKDFPTQKGFRKINPNLKFDTIEDWLEGEEDLFYDEER